MELRLTREGHDKMGCGSPCIYLQGGGDTVDTVRAQDLRADASAA